MWWLEFILARILFFIRSDLGKEFSLAFQYLIGPSNSTYLNTNSFYFMSIPILPTVFFSPSGTTFHHVAHGIVT